MEIKYAYQLDHDGYFIGLSVRQPSPAEPGVWLMPAYSVVVTPPQIPEGHWAKFDPESQTWSLEEIPAPPAPPEPLTPTPPPLPAPIPEPASIPSTPTPDPTPSTPPSES